MRYPYAVALLAATVLAKKQAFTIGSKRQNVYKHHKSEEVEGTVVNKLVVGNRDDATVAMYEDWDQESRTSMQQDLAKVGDRNTTDWIVPKKDDGHVTVLKRKCRASRYRKEDCDDEDEHCKQLDNDCDGDDCDLEICDDSVWKQWIRRFAFCKLEPNPAYPRTNPYGMMRLSEDVYSPLQISGYMAQLPPPSTQHFVAFGTQRWDGLDCGSAGVHFNPTNEDHGAQDANPSHVGDLNPITDNAFGNAFYYSSPSRASLFGGPFNISNRSMLVYEKEDDLGAGSDRIIACCNISRLQIYQYANYDIDLADIEEFEEDDPNSTQHGGKRRRLQAVDLEDSDDDDEELKELEDDVDGIEAYTLEELWKLFPGEFDDISVTFDEV